MTEFKKQICQFSYFFVFPDFFVISEENKNESTGISSQVSIFLFRVSSYFCETPI